MSTATVTELAPPLILPPHVVILENDTKHTFPYVVEMLLKVFKYSNDDAKRITLEIHHKGEAVVWTGQKEIAELKAEQVTTFGNDNYGPAPVTFPLGVRVEPT